MKATNNCRAWVFLMLFSTCLSCANVDKKSLKVDELLERHTLAMGGKKNWDHLESYKLTFNKKNNTTMIITCKMPDKITISFTTKDLSAIKGYDGKHGYIIKNGQYNEMRSGEAIEMAEEPMYYADLIFAKETGSVVQLNGIHTLGDKPYYVVEMNKGNNDIQTYWIDTETYLIHMTGEYSEDKAHAGIYYKTRLEDYRNVSGLMFPFRQELIPNDGNPIESEISDIEINLNNIQDSDFEYTPDNTGNLISYWKDRFKDDHLKSLTFSQETIRYENGKVRDTSLWQEAILFPNYFRIDIGPKENQNRNLFRNDSIYVLRKGDDIHKGIQIQEFMIMEGALYQFSPDSTLMLLEKIGVDASKFRKTLYKDRPTFVIGADEGDLNSPQIWLDVEERYTVKRMSRTSQDKTLEVRYANFQMIDGFPIETWLEFYLDGGLIQTEKYFDIRVNPPLDPQIFDPLGYKGIYWY